MSAPIYFDANADLSLIQGKRVAVIGYGNQGNAQANNLRDNGVRAIRIGNREDEYRSRALAAGFEVAPIPDVAAWGDVVLLLIPDEVQPEVFREQIRPQLRPGTTLVVASGYNVAFGLMDLPQEIDVVMVAPRMIGAGVRKRYLAHEPFPCFVSVEHNQSGQAFPLALSLARGIGATRGGAIGSSAREEAGLDLFSEQALWPTLLAAFRTAYEVLHATGFSDEAILYEMYLSKEPAEIFIEMAEQGLIKQLHVHSHTSQFGQLRALEREDWTQLRARFERVLRDDILSGRFAREWSALGSSAIERHLEQMHARAAQSPIGQAEARVMGLPAVHSASPSSPSDGDAQQPVAPSHA